FCKQKCPAWVDVDGATHGDGVSKKVPRCVAGAGVPRKKANQGGSLEHCITALAHSRIGQTETCTADRNRSPALARPLEETPELAGTRLCRSESSLACRR